MLIKPINVKSFKNNLPLDEYISRLASKKGSGLNIVYDNDNDKEYYRHRTIEVNSVSQFINIINLISEWCNKNGDPHLPYFRGHANKEWPLQPSLQRTFESKITKNPSLRLWDFERMLLTEAIRQRPNIFLTNNEEDLLPIMQHYGLPTRILDFTENPLIALYFSCCSQTKYDGRVFVYQPRSSTSEFERIVTRQVCNLWKYDCYENLTQIGLLSDSQYKPWINQNPKGIRGYVETVSTSLLFFKPSYISPREIVQKSVFLVFPNQHVIHSMGENKTKITIKSIGMNIEIPKEIDVAPLDGLMELSENINCNSVSIIIPYSKKAKIKNELNSLGFCDSDLFPDNIETLTRQIASIVGSVEEV